jgi:hypothetical protein
MSTSQESKTPSQAFYAKMSEHLEFYKYSWKFAYIFSFWSRIELKPDGISHNYKPTSFPVTFGKVPNLGICG